MKVLMVEPHKNAYESDIGNDLKSMQEAVGGSIEAAYFFEEPVALVCNEEGKINGLELNRSVRNEDNEIMDIVVGTFFICGLNEDNFDSLTSEHMEKFKKMFLNPEIFTKTYDGIKSRKVSESYFINKKPKDYER